MHDEPDLGHQRQPERERERPETPGPQRLRAAPRPADRLRALAPSAARARAGGGRRRPPVAARRRTARPRPPPSAATNPRAWPIATSSGTTAIPPTLAPVSASVTAGPLRSGNHGSSAAAIAVEPQARPRRAHHARARRRAARAPRSSPARRPWRPSRPRRRPSPAPGPAVDDAADDQQPERADQVVRRDRRRDEARRPAAQAMQRFQVDAEAVEAEAPRAGGDERTASTTHQPPRARGHDGDCLAPGNAARLLHWRHATHADAARAPTERSRAYTLSGRPPITAPAGPIKSRIGMAAVHVVADPLAAINPTLRGRARLGRDAALPPPRVVAGPGRRRGDGHRAARDGLRLDGGQGADQALGGRGEDGGGRRAGLRRRHRPPGGRPAGDDRRRRGRLRGAVRVDRGLRRPHHPHGQPRAGRVRQEPRRLREGVRPHPEPGARARHRPLAGRDVRSRAGRLLGLAPTATARSRPCWRS